MRILILYDSLYGNTEKIALAIGDTTKLEHQTNIIKVDHNTTVDLQEVDLLILGSPTHGGRYTEPVKKFIDKLPKNVFVNLKVATFDTSFPTTNMGFFLNNVAKIFGNAAPRIAKSLAKKGLTIIDSNIFYVLGKEGPLQEGEIERAKKWTDELLKKI